MKNSESPFVRKVVDRASIESRRSLSTRGENRSRFGVYVVAMASASSRAPLCAACLEPCSRGVSNTESNPGRVYWSHCEAFRMWDDDPRVLQSLAGPLCKCQPPRPSRAEATYKHGPMLIFWRCASSSSAKCLFFSWDDPAAYEAAVKALPPGAAGGSTASAGPTVLAARLLSLS